MVKKSMNYSRYSKDLSIELEEREKRLEELNEELKKAETRLNETLKENIKLKKIKSIINNSHKTPYEKKIALFK